MLLVFVFALTLPAFAGGKHYTCDADVQECLNKMMAKFKDRGWVGIEMDVDEQSGVMSITRVVADSPAFKGGFQIGDQLVAVNGVRFADEDKKAMQKAQGDWKAGQHVTYTVARNGRDKKVYITLGELPDHVLAQWIGKHMVEQHGTVKLAQN